MTKTELNILQEKVKDGTALSIKISAANDLIVTINKLRFSKDFEGVIPAEIKRLILKHTDEPDGIYFGGERFSAEVLNVIDINSVVNETLKKILELVQARKAELEKEFEDYKI